MDLQIAPPTGMVETSSPAEVDYNIIYLNGCFDGGCVIQGGFEDSRSNHSSIVNGTFELPPYPYGNFDDVVACVRNTYARFNVQIVTEDPGNVPHWEHIISGRSEDIGISPPPGTQGVIGGVSPRTCEILDNAITYTFAEVYGGDVAQTCWTVAQETAHAWGLDHELLCSDPMTYLTACGSSKSFQDVDATCGEYEDVPADQGGPRPCMCTGGKQNSVQRILTIFGSAEASPPEVVITEPANGDVVAPGFPVRTTINDLNGVAFAELVIDGQVAGNIATPPFVFNAPGDIGEGTHTVQVRAEDTQGTAGESPVITVTIGQVQSCSGNSDCGDGQVCHDGACIAGPDLAGGLGAACEESSQCATGQCGSDGTHSYCTATCDPGASSCPGGFDCRAGGGSGVCWPASGGDSGGCSTGGGTGPALAIAFALAMVALRRRRHTPC